MAEHLNFVLENDIVNEITYNIDQNMSVMIQNTYEKENFIKEFFNKYIPKDAWSSSNARKETIIHIES